MKKILIMLILGIAIFPAVAQKVKETDLPTVVKDAFQKQYSTAKEVKWTKENDKYEASFDVNKIDNAVVFDAAGKVVETEVEIEMSQLPKGVADYVKTNYKNAAIKETAKITDANGLVTYEAEVKGMDLIFDTTGKFLKEVKD